jgi:putative transposase
VYNHFLNLRIQTYKETGKSISYNSISEKLTELKKAEDTKWLADAGSQILQCSLRDLDTAYNNFFNSIHYIKILMLI